jgi:UDP-glucose 4-epimerase
LARYLVTGGAGYVGSHVVLAMLDRGDDVVVVDDLSKGHAAAVPAGARLLAGRCEDPAVLATAFAHGPFDAVLHFAALSLVGESMQRPMRYMAENLATTLALAEATVASGCRRFVISSTAALFGFPDRIPIDEEQRLGPVSPYGESKLMCERALDWADRLHGLRFASLRYFNAAGADPGGRAGEDHDPETHLVPLAIDAALGLRGPLTVFGTDYPTPDGTGIRDYVHVTDLAEAHLQVLPLLDQGSRRYNLGNGRGYSVREVIDTVGRIAGRPVPHMLGPRRPGDPAVLVASSAKLRAETGWTPRFPDLEDIVRTAHAWRVAHPQGYATRRAA